MRIVVHGGKAEGKGKGKGAWSTLDTDTPLSPPLKSISKSSFFVLSLSK